MYNEYGDREILEISEARVIFISYLNSNSKEQVYGLCKKAERLYGTGSSKRILDYVKQMAKGEME
jgi:hypothetical protein